MPRPYSVDLRQRAVARIEAGETVRAVADTLKISPSAVAKWSMRSRKTGTVAPKRPAALRPKRLEPHRDFILARLADPKRISLRQLQAELAGLGITVDYRTVWTFVDATRRLKRPASGSRMSHQAA